MGFFSVLQNQSPDDGGYAVRECHLNIWSLPGLFGHRPMLFDVGLLLEAETETRAVELAVPLRTVPKVRDLSDVLTDTTTARLVFGNRFDHTGDTINLKQPPDPKQLVDVDVSEREASEEEGGFLPRKLRLELDTPKAEPGEEPVADVLHLLQASEREAPTIDPNPAITPTLVRVPLTDPLPSGCRGYLRIRLVVDHPGTMWRWTRVLGRRNGALIDLRVPDAREGANKDMGLHRRTLPLERLEVFVILSDRYQLRAANPDLAYTRTLEARAWNTYLRRSATGLRRSKNMMVHRWSDRDVSSDHPFRGYLQLNREPAFNPASDLIITGLLSALAVWALLEPLTLREAIKDGLGEAGGFAWGQVLLWLGIGGGILAAVSKIMEARGVMGLVRRAKRRFKQFEYWVETIRK